MPRPYTTCYYFNRTSNLERFEHVSSCGSVLLDDFIGETLAAAFCSDASGIELVRFHRALETIVVQRRLSDIVMRITIYK